MTRSRLPERIIVGNDLIIRRWDTNDADTMAALIVESLDHLRPWMAWAHTEPLSTEARLGLFAKWDRYWASGAGAVYAIVVADELVGGCSLHRRVGPGGIGLGYWLARHGTGEGTATRTAGALVEISFDLDDVDFVQISHTASNRASGAVAKRLGFDNVTTDTENTVTTWRRQRPRSPRWHRTRSRSMAARTTPYRR